MTRSRSARAAASNQSRSVAAGASLPTAKVSLASTVDENARTSSSEAGASRIGGNSPVSDSSRLLLFDAIWDSDLSNLRAASFAARMTLVSGCQSRVTLVTRGSQRAGQRQAGSSTCPAPMAFRVDDRYNRCGTCFSLRTGENHHAIQKNFGGLPPGHAVVAGGAVCL